MVASQWCLEAMSKAEIDDARIRAKETRDKNSHNPFGEYGVKPAKSPFDLSRTKARVPAHPVRATAAGPHVAKYKGEPMCRLAWSLHPNQCQEKCQIWRQATTR